MHTDMEWRTKVRLGVLRGRKKRKTHPIVDGSNQLRVAITCHDHNILKLLQNLRYGLHIAAFWDFQFSTSIAVIDTG